MTRPAHRIPAFPRAIPGPPEQANYDQGKCEPVNLSTGGRGGEESSNRSGRRGTHRTGGVMPDSRRLAGGSAAKAFRFNDKLAGHRNPPIAKMAVAGVSTKVALFAK